MKIREEGFRCSVCNKWVVRVSLPSLVGYTVALKCGCGCTKVEEEDE